MNERFIESIQKQKPSDLFKTYSDIENVIKLLESNIKEIPKKEETEEANDTK